MKKERFKIKFAVYLFLKDGEKYLLSERKNTGYKDGQFSLVAGHVDGGETALEAIIREAKEEAGIDILEKDLKHVFTMHRMIPGDEYIDLYFECENWQGKIMNNEPNKCAKLEWFDANNLPENILNYVGYVLMNYRKGETFAALKEEK